MDFATRIAISEIPIKALWIQHCVSFTCVYYVRHTRFFCICVFLRESAQLWMRMLMYYNIDDPYMWLCLRVSQSRPPTNAILASTVLNYRRYWGCRDYHSVCVCVARMKPSGIMQFPIHVRAHTQPTHAYLFAFIVYSESLWVTKPVANFCWLCVRSRVYCMKHRVECVEMAWFVCVCRRMIDWRAQGTIHSLVMANNRSLSDKNGCETKAKNTHTHTPMKAHTHTGAQCTHRLMWVNVGAGMGRAHVRPAVERNRRRRRRSGCVLKIVVLRRCVSRAGSVWVSVCVLLHRVCVCVARASHHAWSMHKRLYICVCILYSLLCRLFRNRSVCVSLFSVRRNRSVYSTILKCPHVLCRTYTIGLGITVY